MLTFRLIVPTKIVELLDWPGEKEPLLFQVSIQSFVDLIQQVITVLQSVIHTWHWSCRQNLKRKQVRVTAVQEYPQIEKTGLCNLWHTVQQASQHYLGIFANKVHNVPPVPVHSLELASFLRHLLHDVLRTEDGFQVQPLGLNLQPLIYDLLHLQQTLLPCLQTTKHNCHPSILQSKQSELFNFIIIHVILSIVLINWLIDQYPPPTVIYIF